MKTRMFAAVLLMALGLLAAQAQMRVVYKTKVLYDKVDEDGYRLIFTDWTPALAPKGLFKSICISLNYYQGYKCPYFLRLYGEYEFTDDDRLAVTLSGGKELHLYPSAVDVTHSRLGLIRERALYEAFYQLDEGQLNDLLSSTVTGISLKIKAGSKYEWFSKDLKDKFVDKWLKQNYKAIQKRLEKSEKHK